MIEKIKLEEVPANRRRRVRTCDRFAATIVPAGRRRGAPVRGMVRDYDEEGFCLQADAPLAPGIPVRVRFKLPRSLTPSYWGLTCEVRGRVRLTRPSPGGRGCELVCRWDEPLEGFVAATVAAHHYRIGALMLGVLFTTVYLKWNSLQFFWYTPVLYSYSFLIGGYFLSRFLVSSLYRPPQLTGYEPTVSVCVSVRNDEEAIVRTVETVFANDYPDEKREVIVVDDGSADRTPEALAGLCRRFPRLKTFTIPPSGKRHGMATAVAHATGELVVFVDSDTFLFRDALRQLVCGFEDPALGACSGQTVVENAEKNALTGLQEVRYYLSFKMMKASESVFGCVTCCPGCLSAYRREYLLKVLPPWLNQKFLGAAATFGDDRSLTNFILRDYRVIYNEAAVGATLVPETWTRYLTQQARWKKSWLRETLIAGRFMYRKHPFAALSFYISAVCSLLSPLMVLRALFWQRQTQADSIFLYYLVGLILIGMLQCLFFFMKRPGGRWLLGMLMVASQIVIMGPQTYYAMLTMRKNHWGTR